MHFHLFQANRGENVTADQLHVSVASSGTGVVLLAANGEDLGALVDVVGDEDCESTAALYGNKLEN